MDGTYLIAKSAGSIFPCTGWADCCWRDEALISAGSTTALRVKKSGAVCVLPALTGTAIRISWDGSLFGVNVFRYLQCPLVVPLTRETHEFEYTSTTQENCCAFANKDIPWKQRINECSTDATFAYQSSAATCTISSSSD